MISILILTYNEERNIAACLESVRWSDDVLVVDSYSTDQTVELARRAGARVIQNKFINFAEQRNFGLIQGGLKHEWVLHLDADERVTDALRDEMLATVRRAEKAAYQVSSRLMFQGRWLKHAGLFPWYQVRLGRRDSLAFVQVGHGQREVLAADRIGTMREPLVHYSFSKGMADWLEKHNRYSTAEAEQVCRSVTSWWVDGRRALAASDQAERRRALKRLFFRLPCRPLIRFCYMYFFCRGFLDGVPGFTYCCLLSQYDFMITLKVKEIRLRKNGLPL